jgi:hypothetical protein
MMIVMREIKCFQRQEKRITESECPAAEELHRVPVFTAFALKIKIPHRKIAVTPSK